MQEFCFATVGIAFGLLFVLLFVRFDDKWKVLLESLFGIGGSGGGLVFLFKIFKITDQNQQFSTTTFFMIGLIVSSITFLFIMCNIIKDKDDADILRIRDILLGQKEYINKYYKQREKEIDSKLNISLLEQREKEIRKKEKAIKDKETFLENEENKLNTLGKKKLKLFLPENNNIILTNVHLEELPSYANNIFRCIYDMLNITHSFLEENQENRENKITKIVLNSYLISILTCIQKDIFNSSSNSNDVRLHFRYYNPETRSYDALVAVIGSKVSTSRITSIPIDEDNMISRSSICKRALIKSINPQHNYISNNYTAWKDYITYTFYNLKYKDTPFLSFGISVKNSVRYASTFYFMNYFMFEDSLRENIELLNDSHNIKELLYEGDDLK